ncbi:MAG: DHA2 family efflux MFS transporter permease subunit [Parachlamydiaceae bacterium]|nr:DHA2 family efflux MFS transporter permease subunit [Parachlamydiaceae bacterium]
MSSSLAYYQGSRLLLLNFALGLGTFIQILDSSIANVAIPYIAGNLSVSTDQGTWVITSFAASNAIVLPLTGWLSDYFGRIRLFVVSVLLFALASLCCGFSHSLPMLIIFRVLQGAVAGSLIPLSQSILIASNPPEKQGAALGFWTMIVIVAPILGPIIGGYLTEVYSWPWIFYINVPIGLFSAGITWYLLKDQESKIVRVPIDWVGLFFLSVGVACMQVMLDKGEDLDWFSSNFIRTLTITSIISLLYFLVWNHFQKYRIVDFSFFKRRNFVIGTIAITLGYLIYFTSTVTTPLWLQTQQGYTPFWAGVAVAPVGIVSVFASMLIGRYMGLVDLRYVTAVSFFLFSLSFFFQASFTTEVSLEKIMLARFFQGFGIAIFFLPLVQISFSGIPQDKLPSASGLFHFIRILVGSGFGTSLALELWNHLEIFHHGRLSESITRYSESVTQMFEELSGYSPHFTPEVISRIIDRMVEQQAFMLSTNDVLWLAGWLFIFMIPLIFFCYPVKNPHGANASPSH